jgi:hypothetical protein
MPARHARGARLRSRLRRAAACSFAHGCHSYIPPRACIASYQCTQRGRWAPHGTAWAPNAASGRAHFALRCTPPSSLPARAPLPCCAARRVHAAALQKRCGAGAACVCVRARASAQHRRTLRPALAAQRVRCQLSSRRPAWPAPAHNVGRRGRRGARERRARGGAGRRRRARLCPIAAAAA